MAGFRRIEVLLCDHDSVQHEPEDIPVVEGAPVGQGMPDVETGAVGLTVLAGIALPINTWLGWVGGSVKVDGRPPSAEAVTDRLALIRHAMDTLFGGRDAFRCCWTYINCVRP